MQHLSSLLRTTFAILFLAGGAVSMAAEPVAKPVTSEQVFKESMGLEDYQLVTYKNEAGEVLDYAEFKSILDSGKSLSMMKNPGKHTVVLLIKPREEKNTPREIVAKLSVPIQGAMPKQELVDLHGVAHSWNSFRGKPVLLSFFFSECLPCVQEIPTLNEFAKSNPGIGVLAITFDDSATATKFVAKHPLEWPIVADALKFIEQLELQTYPTLLLVAPDGRLLGSKTGGILAPGQDGSERLALETWVGKILKK